MEDPGAAVYLAQVVGQLKRAARRHHPIDSPADDMVELTGHDYDRHLAGLNVVIRLLDPAWAAEQDSGIKAA